MRCLEQAGDVVAAVGDGQIAGDSVGEILHAESVRLRCPNPFVVGDHRIRDGGDRQISILAQPSSIHEYFASLIPM